VVDENDSHVQFSLEVAEIGKQGGDFVGIVLIEPVQANQWVEDKDAWLQEAGCFEESDLVSGQIKTHARCGDYMDVKVLEIQTAAICQGSKAFPNPGQ
jgi:hypothetical protein